MSPDQLVQHLLEQVEGSHFSFIRFVGRVCRHEWDWAPDEGIRSAHDIVSNLLREEHRILSKQRGAKIEMRDASTVATPAAAAATLRTLREATLAALRRELPLEDDEDAARRILQSAVSLAQLDAHALGEIVLLQRLIDPSRATISPR